MSDGLDVQVAANTDELPGIEPTEKPEKKKWQPWGGKNYHDVPKCTFIKPDGNTCRCLAIKGLDKCYRHAPASETQVLKINAHIEKQKQIRSIAHRRCLALPRDLAQRYEIALSDPTLVELKTDIAFIESRIQHLTAKASKMKESRGVIKVIKKTIDTLSNDVRAGRASYSAALTDLRHLVNKDWNTTLLWEEIYALTDQKRKLVEAESKRMKDLEAYLTPEQAFALVASFVATAKEFVPPERMFEFSQRVGKTLKLTKQEYYDSPPELVVSAMELIKTVEKATDVEMDSSSGVYEAIGSYDETVTSNEPDSEPDTGGSEDQ